MMNEKIMRKEERPRKKNGVFKNRTEQKRKEEKDIYLWALC